MIKLSWQNLDDIKTLEQSLKKNEVSIVSTDTIYGLLANITENCFEKLNKLKIKRQEKPYIVLIGSKEKLDFFVDVKAIKPLGNLLLAWPGPLTIIFQAKKDLPAFLKSKQGTIALRMPKHEGLLELLKSFNGLFSTSANSTYKPAPKTYDEIEKDLLEKTALFVDTEITQGAPSTIIDCTDPSHIKMVREGAYFKKELEKYGTKIYK